MDTNNKSYAEIQEMIANLQAELADKLASEKKAVVAEIKRLAATVSLRVEIFDDSKSATKTKSSSVAAKYRNPENFDEIWSGRGLKPKWLKAKIENGAQLDDFLI